MSRRRRKNLAYVLGKRDEKFIELLYAMSKLLKYPFTETEIKRSAYRPEAHVVLENSQKKVLAARV